MKRICHFLLVILAVTSLPTIKASEKIALATSPEVTRADIYIEHCKVGARGTLVICPGRNGNGQDLIENPKWVDFAKKEKLNLVGLSFASNDDPEDRGYFNVASGSGQILLDGLREAFGPKQPPLLLYGMSRGAQFTYSFSRWKPDLVIAWCAYSATRWESLDPGPFDSKGVIACDDEDEPKTAY